MVVRRLLGIASVLTTAGACVVGCGSATDEHLGSASNAVSGPKCSQVEAKDSLLADLVHHSVIVNYPLTRLSVAADGTITGPDLPDLVAGDLDIINTVPEALASTARAVRKISRKGDYTIQSVEYDSDACFGVPAWTPDGPTLIDTQTFRVTAEASTRNAWKTAHHEFASECPLVKVNGDKDLVDPPGDGSTNDPPSATVSVNGIRANAFGLCPSETPYHTACMLSYAMGTNYTGRWCSPYFGRMRCVVY